jgi:hypothetical protein
VFTVPSITRSASAQKAQDPAKPGLAAIKSAGIASGRGPPPLLNVLARSVEMDVLVDVVDPGQRNQVMLTAGFRIAFRQLDVAGTFQVIHGADVLAVGTQDFHVFLDVSFVEHRYASIPYPTSTNTAGRSSRIWRLVTPAGTRPAYAIAVSWSGGCGPGRRC